MYSRGKKGYHFSNLFIQEESYKIVTGTNRLVITSTVKSLRESGFGRRINIKIGPTLIFQIITPAFDTILQFLGSKQPQKDIVYIKIFIEIYKKMC